MLVAVIGYLIGYRHAGAASTHAPATLSHSIKDSGILLEHPAGWRSAHLPAGYQTLGGLQQPLVLAPDGQSTEAGLVVGLLKEPASGPLPPALLAQIKGDPHAEVVLMVAGVQAYRYSRLVLSDSPLSVTAYSIPNVAGHTVVALCYATHAGSKARQECEQIAEALTPLQAEPKELTPYGRLAGLLKGTLPKLAKQRAAIRLQMHTSAASSRLASLATRMADLFGATRRMVSQLPLLPPPGSEANLALIGSLSAVQKAYIGLAAAAASGQSSSYTSARSDVYTAEANLQNALKGLALLGY